MAGKRPTIREELAKAVMGYCGNWFCEEDAFGVADAILKSRKVVVRRRYVRKKCGCRKDEGCTDCYRPRRRAVGRK